MGKLRRLNDESMSNSFVSLYDEIAAQDGRVRDPYERLEKSPHAVSFLYPLPFARLEQPTCDWCGEELGCKRFLKRDLSGNLSHHCRMAAILKCTKCPHVWKSKTCWYSVADQRWLR